MESKFDVKFEQADGSCTAYVSGAVDSTNYLQFGECFDNMSGVEKLVLDFAKVKYISSAGIRAVIVLAKKYLDNFAVINVNDIIYEIFRTTGITKVIKLERMTEDTANSGQKESSGNASWCEILRSYVQETPDKPFLVYRDEEYTWEDVDKISQIIAFDLSRMGAKKNSHIAVFSSETVNQIFTFFAVQKLGAIAVMLNPSYTANEISALSKQGDITYLCGENLSEDFIEQTKKSDSKIEYVYDISSEIDFRSRFDEYTAVSNMFCEKFNPDAPSVMIFTSGSTGTPKGALHSFYSIASGGKEIMNAVKTSSEDRLCHTMPLFHIGGMCLDFMNAYLANATLYLPYFEKGIGIVDRMKCILDVVEKYKCTIFNAVPTTLLSVAGLDEFNEERIRSVKKICTGSQPITPPQINIMKSAYKNATIAIIYGMTEILPATFVTSEDTDENLFNTVGKAVNNVKVSVVANDGSICKTGVAGEIHLSGGQAISCYYKMGLEKQPLSGSGYIETGDLGFLDENGYLHLAGRIKDIIIRGGENIVPGEIVQAISEIDGISDVYVCGVPDDLMGEKVAAAIILEKGGSFDKTAVKAELSKTLAKHKIPSYFEIFDSFPLLANGKLNKVELKKMIIERIKNSLK